MSSSPNSRRGLERVEAQFGLGGGTWIQRLIARGLTRALGATRAPRPQASDGQITQLLSRRIRSDGYDVAYFDGGDADGRPVVFVHGTPGSARGWADYLLHVPTGCRYIALDRPGFGDSGPRDAVVSLADQARALDAIIRAQRAGPAILVGHSYGGPVVVQAAADAPELVSAVVLLAGSLDPALEHVPFVQHIADLWPLRASLLRGLRNANRELIALKGELMKLAPRLAAIEKPFVIVHGTADKLVPFANVAFLKSYLTGAAHLEIIAIEGQDHYLPWDAQSRVREAIGKAAAI